MRQGLTTFLLGSLSFCNVDVDLKAQKQYRAIIVYKKDHQIKLLHFVPVFTFLSVPTELEVVCLFYTWYTTQF